jgi:hypothetical protein
MKHLYVLILWPILCLADQGSQTSASNKLISASARLDFTTNIDKYVFLSVGAGAFPSASSTLDTIAFTLTPSIPGVPTTPINGNNTSVNWNGNLPTIEANSTRTLPVAVRSNAGQVTIRATTSTGLTSGVYTIPLSSIIITSNDSNLPAPLIPNTGTGASVNVTGSTFNDLVTSRAAEWTFAYNNTIIPSAGIYTGQITFTASVP